MPLILQKAFIFFRFNLAQTYIEHAKFLPLDEELEDEEKRLDKLKTEKASARIKKETNAALVLERRKKSRDKQEIICSPCLKYA